MLMLIGEKEKDNDWMWQSHRCHDLKEDLMGTKIFIIFVYLSNMLSTIGVKELRLCT